MTTPQNLYHDSIIAMLQGVHETQHEAILDASVVVGETIAAKGFVHTFGSGHSGMIAREAHGRAGSLAPVNVIDDPCEGKTEQIEGYGARLMQAWSIGAPDCIFVISNSGRNPLPIEVALTAKDAGLKVIAITAMSYTTQVTSRHSCGKNLYQLADVVLDNGGELGDACVELEGSEFAVGPTSTVLGAYLMNCVMAESVRWLIDHGVDAPVYRSANLDGSAEHNAALRSRYLSRRKLW